MIKLYNFQTCKRPGGDLYGIRPGYQCRQGIPVDPATIASEIRIARERGITSEQIRKLNVTMKAKYKDPNSPEAQQDFLTSLQNMKIRTNNYKTLVEVGRNQFQEELLAVSSLMQDFKGGNKDLTLLLANTKSKVDKAKTPSELEDAQQQHEKYRKIFESYQKAQLIMDSVKSKLLKIGSSKEAKSKVAEVNVEKDLDKKRIVRTLQQLHQITNNEVNTLSKVYSSRDRAYAAKPNTPYPGEEKDLTGRINVGNTMAKKLEAVLWHEFGHHIEYSVDEYRDAAYQWMKTRVTGVPVLLNRLVKSNQYEADEKAFPGNFGLGAYVGKYISSRNTEVISMGLERFHSPAAMVEFYQKDPEHFMLILGILQSL
jgi:hypothetical protein